MKLGAKIFGLLSALLILYLLLGLLLPGTWEAEVEQLVNAPPAKVFPLLNEPGAWPRWSPMPETGTATFGARSGPGAGLRWDDPQYGKGEVTILDSQENRLVEYRVEVEGGALEVQGTLRLEPIKDGTRIHWKESGDFGWNPLLGYAARSMGSSQRQAMAESLETLARILAASPGSGG